VRTRITFFSIALMFLAGLPAAAQSRGDQKLFQEAKILLFDEDWAAAQAKLEDLLKDYPASSMAPQAIFYRAKCLSKQKGRQRDALAAYEDYLRGREQNTSLAEEADTSIIELAYDLYARGEKSYLSKIEDRLESPNRVVEYYAAIKLSQVRDKSAADKAVPVLQEIIEKERDPDLKDRARIALLRISPESLREVEQEEPGGARMLNIRVQVQGRRAPEFSISIPWALADLALRAIPEQDRASLRQKGYDLEKIIDDLARKRTSLIEINAEGRVIRIWIE
jgi:hypothetical protein